jgi:glucose-1-phosphate thymidylyltransferase
MYVFDFTGDWFDVGTPKGYLEAQSAIIDGNLIRGETENCDIGNNVHVMEGAKLENVSIDNSIVFPKSVIKDSEIKNSIVDMNAEVEDADLNDALIGAHTSL